MARPVIRLALLASTALVALTVPARADPLSLSTLLAAAVTAATGGAVVGTAATIAGTILAGVVTIGAGAILTALFTSVPKPENGTIAVQQPLPYRGYLYGVMRIPGAIVHEEESSGYLGVVQALLGHQATAFIGLYLNDDFVNVPITGGIISGPVGQMVSSPGTANKDVRYKGNVITIDSRLGDTNPAPYTIISAQFSGTWPSSAVGKGVASLAMLCQGVKEQNFANTYPYVQPKPSAVMQGYAVFDPRDPAQSATDSTTWAFSDNPILCLLHFLCFSDFGSRRPYATMTRNTLGNWMQAANDCDDLMPLKAGGNEKRYRLGGYNTTQQDRGSTVQAMLAACDGWMCERGDGSIDVKVGKYAAPTVILTDDDIIGYQIQRDVATKDKINRITAKYTSTANGYISVETQPMNDIDDQNIRFGPPRSMQMDLTWCQSTGQASRLQKREFIRQGRKTRGTLILKLSGMNACFERWVLVSSNTIPRLSGVVIEPTRPIINLAATPPTVTLTIRDSGPDIDDYAPAVDESPAPYVPQRPVAVGLPIPANLAAVPEESSSGSSTTVVLVLSWDTPLNNGKPWTSLSYSGQYRVAAVGATAAGGWVETDLATTDSGGRTYATTGAVPVGVTLDVQVFSGGGAGQQSDASDIVQVSTALVAPGTPTGIAAAGSTGHATVTLTAPTSDNLATVQLYRAPTGVAFSASSAVGQPIAVTSGAGVSFTDTVPVGTYDYYAVSIATNGAASAPDGPATATVT